MEFLSVVLVKFLNVYSHIYAKRLKTRRKFNIEKKLRLQKEHNNALEYLSGKNIQVVAKNNNPANCPELRPIEDCWSELKRIVYDKCWVANNLDQLRNRIEYAFKKKHFTIKCSNASAFIISVKKVHITNWQTFVS